jgi:hypothetical protein
LRERQQSAIAPITCGTVCTENSIRVDLVTESPTVGEPWSPSYASC